MIVRALVRIIIRVLVRVFFRSVEQVGVERAPADAPLLLVANHGNSLVDPLLISATIPRRARFLGKSTLWDKPLLRPVLALGEVIPVYRRTDPGVDTAANAETFRRCWDVLAAGGAIALFPEGLSHDEPHLMPLKTGAARIVLEAEEQRGPLGVRVVPVGLVFEERGRFRSRALAVVGEPIDPAPELAAGGSAAPEAVRALTGRIREGLESVTISYTGWRDAHTVAAAAELFAREEGAGPPGTPGLAEAEELRRAVAAGRERLAGVDLRPAARAVERYRRLLRVAGLRDDQVTAAYSVGLVVRFALRSLALLLLASPVAVLGLLLNYVPYRLCGVIATRRSVDPDQVSTFKLFPALVLFPLTWAVEVLAAVVVAGVGWAAVLLVLAPTSGWLALRCNEERERLLEETRAFLLLGTRQRVRAELLARRRAARAQLVELAQELENAR